MKKILLLLTTFLLFSCQTEKEDMTSDTTKQWHLIKGTAHGKALTPVPEHQITLQMLPDRWVGTAGVNYYQIPVKYLKNQRVEVANNSAISTRMAGSPLAMDTENRYLHALSQINKTETTDNQLILSGQEIKLIFK